MTTAINIGQLRIAFERAGSGRPLVLLHGGLEDCRAWRRQITDLSRDFEIVAWDAPGCGASADPPETFRLPDYADCLAGLLEALGIGPAHLLGISWGSGLALEFYRRHRARVQSLVLSGAYAGAGEHRDERLGRHRHVDDHTIGLRYAE
jgi:pimeloyl-ACP methyl ester carboxylesterase